MAISTARVVLFDSMGPDRTPAEVAALRATAELHKDRSAYDRVRCGATLATLDWLAGVGPAPATGETYAADEDTIVTEQLRAHDLEDQALRRGSGTFGDNVWPGVVEETLRWYRRYEHTLAPVL